IVTTTSASVPEQALEASTESAAAETGNDLDAQASTRITRTMRVVRLSEELPVDDVQAIATELADSPDVVSARPDIRVHIEAERVSPASVTLPNDTYTADLWGLWDSSRTGGGFGTRAAAAWPTTRGAGVIVAVLDTGIQAHPDLNANLVSGYDFVNDWWAGYAAANDGNGRDPDPTDPGDWCDGDWSSWHGTHVAGTIAAVADDTYGVAGVAPGAKVQPVRVLGRCGGYSSDILAAITWASGGSVPGVPANATPADAINLSLGGSGICYSGDQSIIDAAIARGTSIVVAAGNENQPASNSWPANCSGVITVAASTRSGQRASYSNYDAAVEIAGPGGDWSAGVSGILSTLNSGSTTPGSPTWAYYRGTSMATPHVAAAVALLSSARPSLTPAQITTILQSTAQPFTAGSSCIAACGSGYVDAAAAVASLGSSAPTSLSVTPDYESLVVGWNAPTTGPTPRHYDVQHSTDSTNWVTDDTVASPGTTITGLTPGIAYSVRVRSVTADDSSAWVTSASTQPLPPTVPGAVGSLEVVADDDTTLNVTWTAPASTGGRPIDYYAIEHSDDGSVWVADDTTTALTTTIDELADDSSYTVRVSAVNVIGAGPARTSSAVSPRILALPGPPQALGVTAGDGSLALTWSPPADDGGRSVLTYEVE
ncbi:MAG: hypothetical protein FJ275_10025, partial [Planctomycetes bacterium]|nr:hypothetical protein [Planctomycetota bacterium]